MEYTVIELPSRWREVESHAIYSSNRAIPHYRERPCSHDDIPRLFSARLHHSPHPLFPRSVYLFLLPLARFLSSYHLTWQQQSPPFTYFCNLTLSLYLILFISSSQTLYAGSYLMLIYCFSSTSIFDLVRCLF